MFCVYWTGWAAGCNRLGPRLCWILGQGVGIGRCVGLEGGASRFYYYNIIIRWVQPNWIKNDAATTLVDIQNVLCKVTVTHSELLHKTRAQWVCLDAENAMVASVKQDEVFKKCSYEKKLKASEVLSVEDNLYCHHHHHLLSSYVVPYATQPTV